MDIGVGLPSTMRGVPAATVMAWARRADELGFSTLGSVDRVVYANYEMIPTLGAAAAVTERIRLTTSILLAPVRGNGALLAKQLATIDNLSEGRLTVGVAVGGRADDYAATGVPFEERGRIFDEQLVEFQRVWSGAARGGGVSPIGPSPVQPGGPPLLVGGTSDAAVRRAVTSGVGWISGGGGPAVFTVGAERVRAAWRGSGRVGRPRLVALGYFALGPGAVAAAGSYLGDYYQFLGESAALIVRGALTTPDVVRVAVAAFADAGCDELILFPCSSELDQLDRLAEVTLDH